MKQNIRRVIYGKDFSHYFQRKFSLVCSVSELLGMVRRLEETHTSLIQNMSLKFIVAQMLFKNVKCVLKAHSLDWEYL